MSHDTKMASPPGGTHVGDPGRAAETAGLLAPVGLGRLATPPVHAAR